MIKIKREKVLIKPSDIKPSSKGLEVIGTINPAAARLPNGDIILYVRVIERLKKPEDERFYYALRFIGRNIYKIKLDRFNKKSIVNKTALDFSFKDGTKRLNFISHFRKVILDKSGFKIKSIDKKPSFFGLKWDGELSIEDPRITKINDLYIMTYVTLSRKENISTSCAISNDCINWYRRGIIFAEQDKDVVIFPEKIGDKYVAIDRPESSFQFSLPHMWVNYSKDLQYWGRSKPIILSKKTDWDYGRNGAGPPPIKTKKGWLLLYHAVEEKEKRKKPESFIEIIQKVLGIEKEKIETMPIYSVGAALFDLKNPHKLIAKSKYPVILPTQRYEKGKLQDMRVVFPTGVIQDKDKEYLLLYSGGGDVVTSVKKIRLNDILKSLEKIKR